MSGCEICYAKGRVIARATKSLTEPDASARRRRSFLQETRSSEVELVAGNFNQHETTVGVEAFPHFVGRPEVVSHEFAEILDNEVIGRILGGDSFLHLLMS